MATKITKISAKFITSLAQKVAIGATTGTLTSIADLEGVNLPSGRYGFTIDEGNSSIEYVEADLSGTAISGVVGINPTSLAETVGFVKEHRAGAEVKITDFTVLARIRALITGDTALDGGTPLAYDATPTLSNPLALATVEYVLSVVTGGTITFDSNVIPGMAGESISSGDWVYFKESDGRWYKTAANDTTKSRNVRIGKAKGAGTTGNAISGGVFIGGRETSGTYVAGTSYYLSDTSGALATSAGTERVLVGIGDANSELLFMAVYDPEAVTYKEKQALVGSSGTPSDTNKYVTQDSESVSGTDQSQTTSNGTIETGEADATTKKNLIAQSFIPTKSKIRGVKLYKAADTGTFTGTVVITLQADSSGSPSGTPLATRTITLLEWRNLAVGEFEAVFTSEYSGITTGSLYWIVIDPSTSDNSNHPNLGTNTAGGYSSGSVKYKNTTDSWVAVSTIDLYFKTIEGIVSQSVKTNGTGKIETPMYDVTEMPTPAFWQMIPLRDTTTAGLLLQLCSTTDGSVVFAATSGTSDLHRFARDSVTGQYLETHTLNGSLGSTPKPGMVVLGDYLYVFYDAGANMDCYRYLAADLSGEQDMTFGTAISTGGSNTASKAWTDGKFIYVVGEDSPNTVVKLSVSGTNFTQESTSTLEASIDNTAFNHGMCDGATVYATSYSDPDITIYKLSDIDGTAAPTSTTTKKLTIYSDVAQTLVGLVNIDTVRMYMVVNFGTYDETAQIRNFLAFIPITKP